jgi:hypothetical protein
MLMTGARAPEAVVVTSAAAMAAVVLTPGVEFPQSDSGVFKSAGLP